MQKKLVIDLKIVFHIILYYRNVHVYYKNYEIIYKIIIKNNFKIFYFFLK